MTLAALPAMAAGQTVDISKAAITRVRNGRPTVTNADIALAKQHAFPAGDARSQHDAAARRVGYTIADFR